ncbi:DUF6541 family protein [Cellulomonas sp.]|uniref:DUF6541 family protein n=1 Tax=Cellulomonas sp. TaxID=40001 RepID=UPI001B28ADAE|nr:DUF6541 family protein [Cellulomonas sp.]MBO9556547.1 hypothetical protein [Cellulomonas sp.]
MEWWEAALASVLVVVVFWLPGTAVLAAWGWRGTWVSWAALAPATTLGLLGTAAVVLDGTLPWGPGAACLAVVAVTVPVLAARRLAAHRRSAERYRTGRGLSNGANEPVVPGGRALGTWIAVGVLVQLVAVGVGMGRPGRLATAYDTVVHLNGIAWIRETGSGSSLTFPQVAALPGMPANGFYGAAWHDAAALLPSWPDAAATFNVATVVPLAAAWTLGVVHLTQAALPHRPRVWSWAAAMTCCGAALPLYLTMRPEGMVPNAMGVALVPTVLAVVAGRPSTTTGRRLGVAAVAAAGLAWTHPNALLATALVLAPWTVTTVHRAVRRTWQEPARRAFVAGGVVLAGGVAAAAVAAVARTPLFELVVGWPAEPPVSPLEAVVHLLSADATGMALGCGFVVGAGSVAGGVLAWRVRHSRWLVLAFVTAVAWYLAATSAVPVLTAVDAPWYGEPKRFAPVLAALMIPLAALTVETAWRRLRLVARREGRSPAVATLAVVALLAAPALVSTGGLVGLVRSTYGPDAAGKVADDAELAMLHRLRTELAPDRAVLGSPFSGAADLYALNGQPVVPRTTDVAETPELTYVREHLHVLGKDDRLCRNLAALAVGYLYVDPKPWDQRPDRTDVREAPAQGLRLVDSGGTASVYEITACS